MFIATRGDNEWVFPALSREEPCGKPHGIIGRATAPLPRASCGRRAALIYQVGRE